MIKIIFCDESELRFLTLALLTEKHDVLREFIKQGKLPKNAFIERFNRKRHLTTVWFIPPAAVI